MKNEILESVRNALTLLLDDAEKRNYDPPVNTTAVVELEWVISELAKEE